MICAVAFTFISSSTRDALCTGEFSQAISASPLIVPIRGSRCSMARIDTVSLTRSEEISPNDVLFVCLQFGVRRVAELVYDNELPAPATTQWSATVDVAAAAAAAAAATAAAASSDATYTIHAFSTAAAATATAAAAAAVTAAAAAATATATAATTNTIQKSHRR